MQYARGRYIFKAIMFLLTTAASAVSAYGLSVRALVIASAAAALTACTEFSDIVGTRALLLTSRTSSRDGRV